MDNVRPEKAGGNLLVVDDDLLLRQTLEDFLTGEGYEVRLAANGGMALRFAGEDPPDLILLDIRLPDMDGFEVCRRLREDPRTGRIPVIFISGLDEVVDKEPQAGGARSAETVDEYDCQGRRVRMLAMTVFAGQMGSGDVVLKIATPRDWIPPIRAGEDSWKFACGQK